MRGADPQPERRIGVLTISEQPMPSYTAHVAVWIVVYLFFVLAPLFALLAGSLQPARDFWTEFSAALGYAGLAMMGLQFGITARFSYVTAPWGEDVIYHFHRRISLIGVGVVIAQDQLMTDLGQK